MRKAIWICPALCGCEIEMDADFLAGDVQEENGRMVSYRNPKPFTAKNLVVINVCGPHSPLLSTLVDESKFTDLNEEGEAVQNRGYLKLPVSTDAERLYMNLYGYTAQRWSPVTCGCKLMICYDRDNPNSAIVQRHPKEKRCKHHKNDTDDARAVKAENALYCEVMAECLKTVTAEEVSLKFNDQRKLMVILPNKPKATSDKVLADIESKVGAGKVEVFGG